MTLDQRTPAAPGGLTLQALAALPRNQLAQRLATDAGHAAQWVYQAACSGIVEAQTSLGQMLLDGHGTPADAGAARRWFGRAAEAGYAPAANMLGRCLERGWGGPTDLANAAVQYRRAAEAGLDWGLYNLANMTLRGRGVPCDPMLAFRLFRAAATQGHAKSMNLVGRFLEEGWISPPDLDGAAAWYRRAADGGDFRGQHNLATLLAQAGHVADAVKWFTLASRAGSLDFRRVAADQLLGHADITLQQLGLTVAARNCEDGDGQDFHRYGTALSRGQQAQPRLARVWLQMAVEAGFEAAQAELTAVEAALARSGAKAGRHAWRSYLRASKGIAAQ